MDESHRDWFEAEVPDRCPVILKLRLRPYTIGHEILLQRIGSPLVGARSTQEHFLYTLAENLVIACLVCGQNYREALRSLESPWVGLILKLWRLRLGRKVDWIAEATKFHDYRERGNWEPEICPLVNGRTLKAPRVISLLTTLVREFGVSWRDVYDFPIARAHAWCAAAGDLEGTLQLYGGPEAALISEMERRDKEGTWD